MSSFFSEGVLFFDFTFYSNLICFEICDIKYEAVFALSLMFQHFPFLLWNIRKIYSTQITLNEEAGRALRSVGWL